MTVSLNGTSGIVFNDASTQNTSAFTGGFAFRNRIINGAMVIDQRNAGASSTFGTSGAYTTVDRWQTYEDTSGSATNQQVTDAPTGFGNSLKVTITGNATPSAAELFQLVQYIEGNNIVDMAWGTASASSVSLSFWVKSSLTGQFGGAISNNAVNYAYPFNYSISAANTWERKTITIVGPTAGTWLTDTNIGLRLYFNLGCGSNRLGTANAWTASDKRGSTGDTNLVSTNGATFYITGVQLEKGSTATSFDYRPYGTELALCQRYYYNHVVGNNLHIGIGWYYSATEMDVSIKFPVTMRTAPTLSQVTGTNYFAFERNGSADYIDSLTIYRPQVNATQMYNATQASGTAGQAGALNTANASASLSFDSEL